MKKLILFLPAALLLCGCITEGEDIFARTQSSSRSIETASAKQAMTVQNMEANIQRLSAQMDEVMRAQSQMEQRLGTIESGGGGGKDEIIALRKDLEILRSSNANLRKEIVDELSGKIARMQPGTSATSSARSSKTPSKNRAGYEHKVEKGQTLSEIARGYGTSVDAILKANNLTLKSTLRVGQTLFIPDAQ